MGLLAAIVIAGGEARRFGSDKLALRDAQGRSLLDATVTSVAGLADPVIVVGPERPLTHDVQWTREEPSGGGPCAALIAGLALVPDGVTHVAVLAGDAPAGGDAVEALLRVIDDAAAAVVLDDTGREQPMTAVYRVDTLRGVIASLGDGANRSIREVLDALRPQTVVGILDAWAASADIDVPRDADRLGFT
ncbi:MAG: molybdenum cofactor guanylyltransferase [Candidatus Nanopelagicales bacterium]|nr:molybdenum cofactor guanylyltransferase [Candidatus Nanopelagicales bacterium]